VLIDVRQERRGVMRNMLELTLGSGTVVAESATAAEASVAVDTCSANAVVIEVQLPVEDGLATIAALREAHPSLAIVVCTFRGDRDTQQKAERAGADAYLVKPVSARQFRSALGSDRRLPVAATAPL
jgi:DNA-binding NarL/FixJ family response regulator